MVFMVCSIAFMLLWSILFKLTASQPMTSKVHYSFLFHPPTDAGPAVSYETRKPFT